MPMIAKLLIGFAAALLAGWLAHGPLGRGGQFVDSLQAGAEAKLREAELPGVTVTFPRDPLARTAILSGPANDLQRNGMGGLPGLTQRVGDVPGVAGVRWADEAEGSDGWPLLAETLIMVALAFLVGLGLGKVFFRPRRTSFL
jgi:hypothetical protein